MPDDQDDRSAGDGPDRHGPGRQFFVPAPGGTPDPPPSSPPATWQPRDEPVPVVRPPRSRPAQPEQPPRRAAQTGSDAPRRSEPSTRARTTPPKDPKAPKPPKPPKPPKKPKEPTGPGRRGGRSWKKWALIGVPLLLLALVAFFAVQAFAAYRSIERVDLSAVLDPVTGDTVNYLLVGSDSREGLDPDVPVGGTSTVTGKRSDTIILLRIGPSGSKMMSIPRDLWVTIASTGKSGRINGAYNAGPANLVQTVKDNLNVPVNHYMEVSFESFVGVVDALGGVSINVAHPAFDEKSGLNIPVAGDVVLDGRQALAYARSRTYTEIIDGKEVTDPTADLGRQQRQQLFLRTALADVGTSRNPVELLGVTQALSSGLVIDDSTGLFDLVGLARKLGRADPETVVLPTKGARKRGAAVLVLDEPAASAALTQFK